MGARLKVREIASRWRMGDRQWISPKNYAVDIRRDRDGEFFELRVPTHLSETVHVCTKHPNGISEKEYAELLRVNPKAIRWGWRVMRRNPGVYARGTVRHSDHANIQTNKNMKPITANSYEKTIKARPPPISGGGLVLRQLLLH